MEKPVRSEPAASDSARLATSSDLPTFGSPPTNRMPCGGNSPGSTRQGGGVGGCCSRSWASDRTGAGIFLARGGGHSSASRGGVQQDGFIHHGGFARGGQAQGRQGQFVDLAQDAFGGLIQGLAGGVVEQRLRDAGGFELMGQVGIQFLARESVQVILHGDALAQGFVHLQRQRAAQQGLADQQQSQVMRRIHVEVQQQRKLFEGGMGQQLGFVADENRDAASCSG